VSPQRRSDAAAPVALDTLPAGTSAVVRELRGGRELVHRLAALGLTEGAPIVVLHSARRGPLLVLVRDTRIALGRGEAAKIFAEPMPP
jgi:ferrous iron transport protein A